MEKDKKSCFALEVLKQVALARQIEIEGPNVDTWRFPNGLKDRFDHDAQIEMIDYLSLQSEELDEVAQLYRDEASRELFRDLLAYRTLGCDHIRLPTNRPAYFDAYAQARAWKTAPSNKRFVPFDLGVYDITFRDTKLSVECWLGNVVFSFLLQQYFFQRGGVRVQPEPGDIAIDAGACFGDTSLAFSVAVGTAGRVIAFEAMPDQRAIITENLARNPALGDRITCAGYALSDVSGQTLNFKASGAGSRPTETGTVPVTTITIDDYVRDHALLRVDFIKMDIERSEYEALQGATDTIARFRPKLAISIYHGMQDYLRIPKLIHEMAPFYDFYLDHYTLHWEETILYCLPKPARA